MFSDHFRIGAVPVAGVGYQLIGVDLAKGRDRTAVYYEPPRVACLRCRGLGVVERVAMLPGAITNAFKTCEVCQGKGYTCPQK